MIEQNNLNIGINNNSKLAWKTLGELFEINRGRVISKKQIEENPGEYPVYSSQTFNDGNLGGINSYDYDGEYITWTTDGARAGTVFYRTGKFNVTNVCGLLKSKDENIITNKFAYHYLNLFLKDYVNYSSPNPKLMSNMVANVKVPIPSLEVQKDIVSKLDVMEELNTVLAKDIELRTKQLEYYREELFKFDDSVRNSILGELCKIETGKLNTNATVEGGQYPFFTAAMEISRIDTYEWDDEAIFIIGNAANIGDVKYFKGKFNAYQRTYVLTQYINNVYPKYVYHYLSTFFKRSLGGNNKGIIKYVVLKNIAQFYIPVPPLSQQHKIANALDTLQALINNTKLELEQRTKQFNYYRNLLLTF